MKNLRFAFCMVVLLPSAIPAQAVDPIPIFSVAASATVTAFGEQNATVTDEDSAFLANSDSIGPVEANAVSGSAEGSSWASITDGVLRAFATSNGTAVGVGSA